MPQYSEMFIKQQVPRRRAAVFDAQHHFQHPAPETGFQFCLAKPRMIGKYRVDRYLIYRPRPFDNRVGKMKHVSRAVRTQDQSRTVSLSPSGMNTPMHGLSADSSSPNYLNPMSITEDTVTDIPADDTLESAARWFNSTGIPGGHVNPYTYYDELVNSLSYGTPPKNNTNTSTNNNGGQFNNPGATGGGMPTYFGGSSPSTYPLNGSSPNTMFGSFSSSIGPPDHIDMGVSDLPQGPLRVSGGTPSGLFPGSQVGQQQNIFTNPSPDLFSLAPNPGTTHTTTISPNKLQINPITPNLPASNSSESLSDPYAPFHVDTESDDAQSSTVPPVPEHYILSSSGQDRTRGSTSSNNRVLQGSSGSKWGRKQLPDRAPTPQHIHSGNGNSSKRRSAPDNAFSLGAQPKRSKPKKKTTFPQLQHPDNYYPAANFASVPVEADTSAAQASASPAATGAEDATNAGRSALDDFLVKSRMDGLKYKEIRQLGNFKEAESTLRGRFRTLVKPKEARVRNPQWQEIDDKLLKKAVLKLSKSADRASGHLPWRAVAEYIRDNGGSYHFGSNTCHKRWDYLNKTSAEQVKKDRDRGNKES